MCHAEIARKYYSDIFIGVRPDSSIHGVYLLESEEKGFIRIKRTSRQSLIFQGLASSKGFESHIMPDLSVVRSITFPFPPFKKGRERKKRKNTGWDVYVLWQDQPPAGVRTLEIIPDSSNHSLSGNFPEKEFLATGSRLTLSVHLFRCRLPTATKPYLI